MVDSLADEIVIRRLRQDDFDHVVRIDREHSGQERANYYAPRFAVALDSSELVMISLVAEVAGEVVGFIMGELSSGEFGTPERSASVDAIGVAGRFTKQGVGSALIEDFARSARVAGVEKLYTRVMWNQLPLISFFDSVGFVPGQMINLELNLGEQR